MFNSLKLLFYDSLQNLSEPTEKRLECRQMVRPGGKRRDIRPCQTCRTHVENYRRLHDAGIGTYILFQETYHKENYENPDTAGIPFILLIYSVFCFRKK